MLVDSEVTEHPTLHMLAKRSAAMYPEFVHHLEDESGVRVDLRSQGTIRLLEEGQATECSGTPLTYDELRTLEPAVEYDARAMFVAERCLDPRLLMEALVGTAKHLGVDIASGSEVTEVAVEDGRTVAAVTTKTRYKCNVVVNCAGAWAGHIAPFTIPALPVKGQMLAVTPCPLKHVVRANDVYLIPRSSGRLVIGATLEVAGYDKRVLPDAIQRLHQAAAVVAPVIGESRILEDWAGLRPGTPDKVPIMSKTELEGYFVSTGHYRDGILLAPLSARLMAQMITGETTELELSMFSLSRFTSSNFNG
jgi:glycine oxidase